MLGVHSYPAPDALVLFRKKAHKRYVIGGELDVLLGRDDMDDGERPLLTLGDLVAGGWLALRVDSCIANIPRKISLLHEARCV